MKNALIVIDVQNDYFAQGAYPQANADRVCARIVDEINKAKASGELVVVVQHLFEDASAPLFVQGTHGAKVHADIEAVTANCPVVIKAHANSFLNTDLEQVLNAHNITGLKLCGMMTQNCITHTAIAKEAEKYTVKVIGDACTAPTELIHGIAMQAIADRVAVV